MGKRICAALIFVLSITLFLVVKKDADATGSRKLLEQIVSTRQVTGPDSTAAGQRRFALEAETPDLLHLMPQARLDRIVELPGQPEVSYAQYAGYVTVNEEKGNAFFYWLTEATEEASSKPLVLWLNGGPGCSSVAYGASEELGPFRIDQTGASLYRNHYSWNRVANLLFVESPAGVGFSYSNSSNLQTGDTETAKENLQFVLNWFKRFPEYRHREFYISGESYAGHYVPQLTKLLYEYNKGSSRPSINLKGFLVGNAVTDNTQDSKGLIDYWWSHAIISDDTYHAIQASCNFTSLEPQPFCTSTVNNAVQTEFGNIDIYSIYSPICSNHSSKVPKSASQQIPGATGGQAPSTLPGLLNLLRYRLAGYDPCSENYAEIYYNRDDVQQALHANTTLIQYPWTPCSNTVNQNWQDSDVTVLPIYQELIASGLRIWVFSGDTDAVVPVTSTRYALNKLNLQVKTPWYPWYHESEVGGWIIEYENLTFATVRGAGHEVPNIEPSRALALVTGFLSGQLLPRS